MAKNKNSILGGMTGTVGNLVAYQSNGKQLLRRRPEFKKNRAITENQELARAKFKMASDFFRKIEELLSVTYTEYKGSNLRTAAMANLTKAVEGDLNSLSFDYRQVLVSTGKLVTAKGPVVSSTQPGFIDFQWRSIDVTGSSAADKSVMVAWCDESDEIWYTITGPQRSALEAQLEVPFFSGKKVHTWLSFISEDGFDAARSVYGGEVLVA